MAHGAALVAHRASRELAHALSTRRFAREAAGYVPELEPGDFSPWYAGIRAQAVARDGRLVDDFVVSETERALHVRNAPSPAATLVPGARPPDRGPRGAGPRLASPSMRRLETRLEGPILLEPDVHGDARGFFVETARANALAELRRG